MSKNDIGMPMPDGDDDDTTTLTDPIDHPSIGDLRDRHLAEDATQQAFLDIWRTIRRLRNPSRFEAWSYRLLVCKCYTEARRRPESVPQGWLNPALQPAGR